MDLKCDKNDMVIGGNNPETESNGLGCLLLLTLANSGVKNSQEFLGTRVKFHGNWKMEFPGIPWNLRAANRNRLFLGILGCPM